MYPTRIATLCALALATCGCTPLKAASPPATEMANPAAVNCIKVGGSLSIKHTPQGELSMCKLPSGKVCDAWALFRGECS